MRRLGKKSLLSLAALVGISAGLTVALRYEATTSEVKSNEASETIKIGEQRFLRWATPREIPNISFLNDAGKTLSLMDFRGRVVLLNVWATWCPPCREEMPSLDRLNAERGGPSFEVVALSIDRDTALVGPFYREIGVKTLKGYFDSNARASAALGAFAVPATLLIDRQGREVGRALGPAEWDSAEVKALIDELTNVSPMKN
ncbi:TlpA disulfide reductase family protein [Noviherbaspirillum sp. CPCC 100848]|jgi:thiol-disulfide isomerase/thioredoxin|uniref:TlpA disulfide reductase family protein n=1 Tax=Noviherbaspirillum album TaxID=3080276 RepID=A0ABU6JFN5_9BURK|nr:TlpA disulfide reductase family protein [Noviherbaspirillum sp. CPCC 100848]MEC4722223.1 TlpA disulfide reductase family protein [Noviherbaspirillum sp. CPCC 100848]